MTTPDKIAKLPKWARDHIAQLERERHDAVRELRDATSGSLVDPRYQKFNTTQLGGDPFWLPQYGRISYASDPEAWDGFAELEITDDRHGEPGIEVRTSRDGYLTVTPVTGNVIRVALRPRN